jgi:hypothetical protein
MLIRFAQDWRLPSSFPIRRCAIWTQVILSVRQAPAFKFEDHASNVYWWRTENTKVCIPADCLLQRPDYLSKVGTLYHAADHSWLTSIMTDATNFNREPKLSFRWMEAEMIQYISPPWIMTPVIGVSVLRTQTSTGYISSSLFDLWSHPLNANLIRRSKGFTHSTKKVLSEYNKGLGNKLKTKQINLKDLWLRISYRKKEIRPKKLKLARSHHVLRIHSCV